MQNFLTRIPFLIELFINGSFIFLYALKVKQKVPSFLSSLALERLLEVGVLLIPLIIFFNLLIAFMNAKSIEEFLRKHIFSIIVTIPLILTWGDYEFAFWLASAHLLSSALSLYDVGHVEEVIEKPLERSSFNMNFLSVLSIRKLSPAQLIMLSFFTVIVVGTLFLKLPFAAADEQSVSWVDALFMVTSATCVTGLTTISISDTLSIFGQLVILVLIQIGGLGFMTLSSSMAIFLGKSLEKRDQLRMQDLLEIESQEDLSRMIVDIVRYTFFIEVWGGVFLSFAFIYEGMEFGQALYYGFYHSISAFCNAGFSLFNSSFENYATNPIINFTIAVLIILGGLGFIVLREVREIILRRKSVIRISTHSKTVLFTSVGLILAGTVMIFFGEFLNTLDSYSLVEKIQAALFQSITLRTAGFNTLPLASLHSYILYAMIIFMFIGGSPGSTAGGIKTTTFAILLQSIKATLYGKSEVTLFNRLIHPMLVVKATALAFISIVGVTFFVLILLWLEPNQSFLSLLFETVSAFGTVGLSVGITPYLAPASKVLISLVMFIGRIGPLTLVLALGQKNETGSRSYPEGRIIIG